MFKAPEEYRYNNVPAALMSSAGDGNNGAFAVPYGSFTLFCIASDGEGWEHVSVSLKNRTPNWGEMSYIKSLFWGEEDTVVQYHPPKSEYVNNHENCLHLWRPVSGEILLPDSLLVGIK